MSGHAEAVNDVTVTPDGLRAVSASLDQSLKLWDLNSREENFPLKFHTDGVLEVAVTPDGRRAISASHDETIKYGTWRTGKN